MAFQWHKNVLKRSSYAKVILGQISSEIGKKSKSSQVTIQYFLDMCAMRYIVQT
jgi:hypothetical protein